MQHEPNGAGTSSKNFALTGAAGFVAPRHMGAIRDGGHHLVAALDPSDSVGVLDRHGLGVRFFTESSSFQHFLESLRDGGEATRVHYVSVCSPNYVHDAHCRMGIALGAHVICEKPVVIDPAQLDALEELEGKSATRIFTVLHLRTHDRLVALREQLLLEAASAPRDVVLTYVTARGNWYDVSWKGRPEKSGGLATNIGIHLFDLLVWLFGPVRSEAVHVHSPRRMAGLLHLDRARVRWLLSVDAADLPRGARDASSSHRSISIDGTSIEFSDGFADLHTRVYERTLAGNGFGLRDARPSIELAHRLRHLPLTSPGRELHPSLSR